MAYNGLYSEHYRWSDEEWGVWEAKHRRRRKKAPKPWIIFILSMVAINSISIAAVLLDIFEQFARR